MTLEELEAKTLELEQRLDEISRREQALIYLLLTQGPSGLRDWAINQLWRPGERAAVLRDTNELASKRREPARGRT